MHYELCINYRPHPSELGGLAACLTPVSSCEAGEAGVRRVCTRPCEGSLLYIKFLPGGSPLDTGHYLKLRHVSKGDRVVMQGEARGFSKEHGYVVVKECKIETVNGQKP